MQHNILSPPSKYSFQFNETTTSLVYVEENICYSWKEVFMENMLDKHSNPFQLVSHVNWLELSGKKIFFKIISMKVKQ